LKAKAEEEEEEEEGDGDAALPRIELGGSLPSVTLKNEKGEDIQVADLAAEKGVILFLVPKADTRTLVYSFCSTDVPTYPFCCCFFLHSWLHKPSLRFPGYLS